MQFTNSINTQGMGNQAQWTNTRLFVDLPEAIWIALDEMMRAFLQIMKEVDKRGGSTLLGGE